MYEIKAEVLDNALADISDVPVVCVENGTPTVVFSGNYEPPVNDLTNFLAALQRADEDLAAAAREGLYWQDGFYGGHGEAQFNGLTLVGVSKYDEDADDEEDE